MNKGFVKLGVLLTFVAIAFLAGVAMFNHSAVQNAFATQQEVVEDGCDHECPTFEFSAERYTCPGGYARIGDTCYKFRHDPVPATLETFGPIQVQYGLKSNDPNKCHRPTAQSQGVPSWAIDDYNDELDEFVDSTDVTPPNYYAEGGACYPQTPVCNDPEATNYDSEVDKTEVVDNKVCEYPQEDNRTHVCPDPEATNFDSEIDEKEEVADREVCEYKTPEEPSNPGNPPTFAGSSTEAPVCPDGNTVNVPANPHVWRAGEKATVNFFITEGDSADVVYKEVNASDWQHAVSNLKPNADRFVSVDITGLDPKLGYTFGVRQRIGCGGGQTITAVIIDGPEPTLFQFSYWEVK